MLDIHYRAFCKLLNIDPKPTFGTPPTLVIRSLGDEISLEILMMLKAFFLLHWYLEIAMAHF